MSDALVNGLAGASGGIIAQILTYPLQVVNTRQQVRRRLLPPPHDASAEGREDAEGTGQRGHDSGPTASPACSGPTASPAWSGLEAQNRAGADLPGSGDRRQSGGHGPGSRGSGQAHAKPTSAGATDTAREMWEIVRAEGFGALYRGLEPSLVGTACSQGVYYYFYQLFRDQAELRARRKKAKGKGSGEVSMVESLVVAALAGCVNVLLTTPIWIIVIRMQTQSVSSMASAASPARESSRGDSCATGDGGDAAVGRQSPSLSLREVAPPQPMGALATIWELFEEAGILGFWKGVLPTLVMVSNPAIQFTIYETLMTRITRHRPQAKGGAKSASAWEIFFVGALAKLGATLVTYPLLVVKARLQARASNPSAKYSGTWNALMRIILEEGVSGLYKGIETKIVQSVFAASVLFLTKEELVKLVRVLVERREQHLQLRSHKANTASS